MLQHGWNQDFMLSEIRQPHKHRHCRTPLIWCAWGGRTQKQKVEWRLPGAGDKRGSEVQWNEVKVTQSCPTLCDHMDCSLPGSSVHGILQARHWSGLPFPSPRDLPNPGTEARSPALQADSLPSEPPGKPRREEGGLLFNGQSFNFARWEIPRDLLHNSVHYYTLKNGEDGNFWNLFFTIRTEHLIREASLMA